MRRKPSSSTILYWYLIGNAHLQSLAVLKILVRTATSYYCAWLIELVPKQYPNYPALHCPIKAQAASRIASNSPITLNFVRSASTPSPTC